MFWSLACHGNPQRAIFSDGSIAAVWIKFLISFFILFRLPVLPVMRYSNIDQIQFQTSPHGLHLPGPWERSLLFNILKTYCSWGYMWKSVNLFSGPVQTSLTIMSVLVFKNTVRSFPNYKPVAFRTCPSLRNHTRFHFLLVSRFFRHNRSLSPFIVFLKRRVSMWNSPAIGICRTAVWYPVVIFFSVQILFQPVHPPISEYTWPRYFLNVVLLPSALLLFKTGRVGMLQTGISTRSIINKIRISCPIPIAIFRAFPQWRIACSLFSVCTSVRPYMRLASKIACYSWKIRGKKYPCFSFH